MQAIAVPYHLDQPLDRFEPGVPFAETVSAALPAGGPWERMAVLYERVASVVAGLPSPSLVLAGDCTTSLGVIAGLQRRGLEVGIVWFDAHADFHTEQSTTSGYLGGMPLALAAGLGNRTLPRALGLHPVAESRILLVDARDTDPGELELLAAGDVTRRTVAALTSADVPAGPLYLHIDVDVADPREVPGLLFPTPRGPELEDILVALRLVVATGRVAIIGLAATWDAAAPGAEQREHLARQLSAACR